MLHASYAWEKNWISYPPLMNLNVITKIGLMHGANCVPRLYNKLSKGIFLYKIVIFTNLKLNYINYCKKSLFETQL